MELNENGKSVPKKIGTKPVQKDEMEYEFMLNFNIDIDHIADTSKDNTRSLRATHRRLLRCWQEALSDGSRAWHRCKS